MIKNPRPLFLIYTLLLIVYFWKTASLWFDILYTGSEKDILLTVTLLAIELLILFLIRFSPKYDCQYRRIHWLCFVWEAIMIVVLLFNKAPISHYIKCLAWPLFLESAYLFVRFDIRMLESFRKVFYIFIFIGTIVFFQAMGFLSFSGQSNMIYFMLLPVPVLMLRENTKWQYSLLIFASFFALLSMKRSIMLAFALCWCIIVFKYLIGTGRKRLAILLSVFVITLAYGFFNVVDNYTGGNLSSRTVDYEKDDITNGREAIYLVTLDMIVKSSPSHLLLGNGHDSVRRNSIKNISAHNEFLEIIYDYGIIILLVYFVLWGYVVRQWIYHYRNNTPDFIPYTLSISIFAVMAMVSQLVLYVSYFLYLVMFWGMVHALKEMKQA